MTFVYLHERVTGTGNAIAVSALAHAGRPSVAVDLRRLANAHDPVALVALTVREALLANGGVVAGPVAPLAEEAAEAVQVFASAPVPVLLVGTATWDPQWSMTAPLVLEVPPLLGRERLTFVGAGARAARRCVASAGCGRDISPWGRRRFIGPCGRPRPPPAWPAGP